MDEDLQQFPEGQSLNKYVAIDREALLFGNFAETKLLSILAKCDCIESDIKAVIPDDAAGANFIVLSMTKLGLLGESKKLQLLNLLRRVGAIRDDITLFSDDISLDDSITRNFHRSAAEANNLIIY